MPRKVEDKTTTPVFEAHRCIHSDCIAVDDYAHESGLKMLSNDAVAIAQKFKVRMALLGTWPAPVDDGTFFIHST